jgi:hypothetical protein
MCRKGCPRLRLRAGGGRHRHAGLDPSLENLAPAEVPAHAIAWLATAEADAFAGQEIDVRNPEFRAACGLPVLP